MPNPPSQIELFPSEFPSSLGKINCKKERTGSFVDNLKLPIHGWYRYSAGYSAQWAEKIIENLDLKNIDTILDPFAGSGTSLIASDAKRIRSIGFEPHKFVFKIAQAKLSYNAQEKDFLRQAVEFISLAEKHIQPKVLSKNSLILKCFTGDNLRKLEALKNEFFGFAFIDTDIKNLIWLAITSILRNCSAVGTAPCQYVLPNKIKSRVLDPFVAFREKIKHMYQSMLFAKNNNYQALSKLLMEDARMPTENTMLALKNSISLVITSPPYPNNYDYADATRLEMTFWGEVETWGDLHDTVRKFLMRSCSQHTAKDKLELDELLADPNIKPIYSDLSKTCKQLAEIRHTKGGKKTYHTMVAAYFADLAKTWKVLRYLCRKDSQCCFVIGDSAPYGIHVPAEKWLGELSIAAGFKEYKFNKIRDRNIKWKNRKHRVPLQEGNLWVKG